MEDTSITKEEEECGSQGNNIMYCSPTADDIWVNGTTHPFIWNSQYPYYTSESWKGLDPWSGSFTVQVNDSWFPSYSKNNWTLYGFYLPSSYDVNKELNNPNSLFPSMFNFSIIRYNNNNNNNNNNNKSIEKELNPDHSIPIWIITIIVTASITILLLMITLIIWRIYKKSFKQDHPHSIEDDFDPPIYTIQNKTPSNPSLSLNEKYTQPTSSKSPFTSNWNQQEKKKTNK
ncbi:unnamed protein product [Cunninghamella blakesleeana]